MKRLLLAVGFLVLAPPTLLAQTPDDLFSPLSVNRLDLLVNSRDWEKLKADFLLNEYYPADVKWNGMTVHNVGIRSRGLGSRSGTKPALRVDMNRYTTGQQFLGLKSFMLDNLVQDATGIRERVTMRVYARMGLPAPRETHVALYVNNQYAGLYGLIESIDKDFLARVFGEVNGDTENDGYLFEYDWASPWFWEYLGANLDAYTFFDATTHENASMTSKYSAIEAMVRQINQGADFEQAVGPYLDLQTFMRHMAVQNFVADSDSILGGNGTANFHFYRFEGTTRHQFIAWDHDKAFSTPNWSIFQSHDDYVLMRRAMEVPALRSAYFDGLLEVANIAAEASGDPGGARWLEMEMRHARDQIDSLMRSDTLKPYSNGDYDAAVNDVMAFARDRAAFVRCEVTKARGGSCSS